MHKIFYFSTIKTLQDVFGTDIKDDFGQNKERGGRREVVFKNDFSVAVFEFFALEKVGMDRLTHPVASLTRTHAQAMCLFIGADLMDDQTYLDVVKESGGEYATPNGQLFGLEGEEYVWSSIKKAKEGTADVNDSNRPEGPYGTKDYTGNVEKFMKETVGDRKLRRVGFRGGAWRCDGPEVFAASPRGGYGHPGFYNGDVGFVARKEPH